MTTLLHFVTTAFLWAAWGFVALFTLGCILACCLAVLLGAALLEDALQRLSLPRFRVKRRTPEPLTYDPPRPWAPASREHPRTEALSPEIILALTGNAPHEGTARERTRKRAA